MSMGPFAVLTVYSIAIITGPIGAFFGTKHLVEYLKITDEGNVYGAVVAVLTVHVVLFAFVYRAFQEEKTLAKVPTGEKEE